MIGAKKSKAATRRLRVHHLKSGGPAAVPLAGDSYGFDIAGSSCVKRYNGNVHRAAAKIIVSKSRAARGSVCNVLLSRVDLLEYSRTSVAPEGPRNNHKCSNDGHRKQLARSRECK